MCRVTLNPYSIILSSSCACQQLSRKGQSAGCQAVVKFGKNKPKDRIATRLDFEGSVEDPHFDITDAISKFIRNSFRTAERASLEHRVWFSRAGKTAEEVEIHDASEPRSRVRGILQSNEGNFPANGATDASSRAWPRLSPITPPFPWPPFLSWQFRSRGWYRAVKRLKAKSSNKSAGWWAQQIAAIQSMIHAAHRPSQRNFGQYHQHCFSSLAGATGVLSELKSALNQIWRTQEHSDVKEIVKKNVVFVGMLLGIGFLLTVSLIMSAGIAGLGKFLGGLLPGPEPLLQIVDLAFSVGFITVFFAAIYRFLPNVKVEWRDVWVGALVTSLLFNLGKLGLGLYIGKGTVGSSYGAAGSILVLLLWVYYSGLIFYFGAKFTKVYAERYGSHKIQKRRSVSKFRSRRQRLRDTTGIRFHRLMTHLEAKSNSQETRTGLRLILIRGSITVSSSEEYGATLVICLLRQSPL